MPKAQAHASRAHELPMVQAYEGGSDARSRCNDDEWIVVSWVVYLVFSDRSSAVASLAVFCASAGAGANTLRAALHPGGVVQCASADTGANSV